MGTTHGHPIHLGVPLRALVPNAYISVPVAERAIHVETIYLHSIQRQYLFPVTARSNLYMRTMFSSIHAQRPLKNYVKLTSKVGRGANEGAVFSYCALEPLSTSSPASTSGIEKGIETICNVYSFFLSFKCLK